MLTGFEWLRDLAVALAPQVKQLALLQPLVVDVRVIRLPNCGRKERENKWG